MIPKKWYLELEVCKGTTYWEDLTHNFKVTFKIEYDAPWVDTTLHIIKTKIFTPKHLKILVAFCIEPIYFATNQEVLECYNVLGEDQEDEDSRNLQIP
jgi:hypothetical protein